MTRIKVCGIRRAEDASLAVELGAWAVGFIFHRASPRWIEPAEAAALASGPAADVLRVGVFVDWPVDDLNDVARQVRLDVVQLHGGEAPSYAARVAAPEVWKAFRVGAGFRLEDLDAWDPRHRVLLDTYRAGRPGGTGETFDWSVAREAQARRPVILAGGIGPHNILAAIEQVGPWAVDVSSGVEVSPGAKDPAALRRLFLAASTSGRDPEIQ